MTTKNQKKSTAPTYYYLDDTLVKTLSPLLKQYFSHLEEISEYQTIDQFKGFRSLHDILSCTPYLIPSIIETAYNARSTAFKEFFLSKAKNSPITGYQDPILPCEKTLDEIISLLLMEAAKSYLMKMQVLWALRSAERNRKEYQNKLLEERERIFKRLSQNIRRLVVNDPIFHPKDYAHEYQGDEIFNAIHKYLKEVWQFEMLTLYASMPRNKLLTLGPALLFIKKPSLFRQILEVPTENLLQLKECIRAFIEVHHKIKAHPSAELKPPDSEEYQMYLDVVKRTTEILIKILTDIPVVLDALLIHGPKMKGLIEQYTLYFGEDIWLILPNAEALTNVVNTPTHYLKILKHLSCFFSPSINKALHQIHDQEVSTDILKVLVEDYPPEKIKLFFTDKKYEKVWEAMPGKLNNQFSYQRDMLQSTESIKNFKDLKMIARGLFANLK